MEEKKLEAIKGHRISPKLTSTSVKGSNQRATNKQPHRFGNDQKKGLYFKCGEKWSLGHKCKD